MQLLQMICRKSAFLILATALAACGGGGGGSSSPAAAASTSSGTPTGSSTPPTGTTTPPSGSTLTMAVSPSTVSVSAPTSAIAPTASFTVTVSAAYDGTLYVGFNTTKVGVSTVTFPNILTAKATLNGQIVFDVPSALGAGTYTDSVTISLCYDAGCAKPLSNSPQTITTSYTVTPAAAGPTPILSSLSPAAVTAGSTLPFTLTANGSGFVSSSIIEFNGLPLATTFVSPTQLTAVVPTSDTSSMGTASIQVSNAAANGAASQPLILTINPSTNPVLTALSPTTVTAGGSSFFVTVIGTGFSSSSIVYANDEPLVTTFVSATELSATVPAFYIPTGAAIVAISVRNGAIGSGPIAIAVNPPSPDAVAQQIDPAQTGVTSISSLTLPTTPKWSANFVHTLSYALVAQGLVFVSSGNTVEALNQSDGSVAWGPVAFNGTLTLAYDSGMLMVQSTAGIMLGLNAATGAQVWSTPLPGQSLFISGITARNGIVYTSAAGSGGTAYAVSEATGAILWTAPVENGSFSTPNVTVDGVYFNYPCQTYDFNPLTGETIWHFSGICEGGGGATGVVANGVAYAPVAIQQPFNGYTFNAETGAAIGNYNSIATPAVSSSTIYTTVSAGLQAISLSNNTTLWTFAGDGTLVGSPIVVNQYAFIGSQNGNLYAVDTSTGLAAWTTQLSGGAVSQITSGDGLLVVPNGTTITVYSLTP